MKVEVAKSAGWLRLRAFATSVWLFPALLFVAVCSLAALRISGTSVGMYHFTLYGGAHDPNLIAGRPQAVRSDEWLVTTPFTVSQSHFGYPRVNPAIGPGFDASVITDIPYSDWSEIFKPHHWPFFVMPLENAFAFKWWFTGYLLTVSVYFAVLLFLPGRRLLAAVLSLGFLAAPFVQWWYQAITLAPIYWTCFAIIAFVYMVRAQRLRNKLLIGLGLAYVLSCLALVLYPPFQIPLAMTAIAVCLGYLLIQRPRPPIRKLAIQVAPAVGAVLVAGLVLLIFFLTRQDTVHAIMNSVYPGHREVTSGGFLPLHLLDGFLDLELQSGIHGVHYIANQSEDANFIFLWPYLLVPSIWVLIRQWRRKRQLDWPLLLVNVLPVVWCVQIFAPVPPIISMLMGLSSVPHIRLLIGFGLINVLQLVLLARHLRKTEPSLRMLGVVMAGVALAVQVGVGLAMRHAYPQYVTRLAMIVPMAFLVALMVYFVIDRKATLAAMLLLAVSVGSTYYVNPLYRGLGELTDSKVVQAADSEPGGQTEGWAYFGSISTVNLLSAGGLHSYTATYPVPQVDFWKQFDPSGQYKDIYNRYGFAMFMIDDPSVHGFRLNQTDLYSVEYDPCQESFKRIIRHVLSQSQLNKSCLVLDKTVSYPNLILYVYRVQ
jgi:hypothetical protein